jgi:DNA-binding CsgD family transcriptional regulator
MGRLRQKDHQALLEFLGESYAIRDLDAFPSYVISALRKIVPADIASYNVLHPWRGRVSWVWEPADLSFAAEPIFEPHVHQHPSVVRYQQTRDGRASKISDYLTRSRFHRLELYQEFYRRMGVEYELAIGLPLPRPLVIGIALSRSRVDFSERDRRVLNLLRPHLIQAYRNAEVVSQVNKELALVTKGVEQLSLGVMVLTRDGRVQRVTARAQQWLGEYFGSPGRRRANGLPESLRRWIRQQEADNGDVPAPRKPLVVERPGGRLVVRLLSDPDQSLLLLEEQPSALRPAALEPVGLTRREAEVLIWVAQGKTNVEIGTILGASPRTVQKHLEHIYRKLGVETRTGATVRALELLNMPGRQTHGGLPGRGGEA